MGRLLQLGIQDVDPETYHADRSAVSKSWLDRIERSPAHLKAYLDGVGKGPTASMELGTLTHTLVLEPDTFTDRYVVAPKVDRRTKKGKELWQAFEEENAGRIVVPEDMWQAAHDMRDAVYRKSTARTLLNQGAPEQTVVWTDPDTHERCKARADWLRNNTIVDLKTTQDASPDAFAKSIARYRYHVQATHYEAGFDCPRFAIIAVESSPPYGVGVYLVDSEWIAVAWPHWRRNLETYAECKARNEWPDYPDEIQLLEPPRWA